MENPWVGYTHLFVTTTLACIVAFYGRKYGKTFEAAKKAEIEAKDAWIARLEGELKMLREMSSEYFLKHSKALKENLEEHIKLLEEDKRSISDTLANERTNTKAQQSRIAELEKELKEKSKEIDEVRDVVSAPAWRTDLLEPTSTTYVYPTKTLISSGPELWAVMQQIEKTEKLLQKARDISSTPQDHFIIIPQADPKE